MGRDVAHRALEYHPSPPPFARPTFRERIHNSMQANDLRRGMVVLFNGDLCKVLEFHHHTPGNLRAMVQAKLRNLRTGNQFEHRFRSQDEVEQAFINQHEMEYLYSDGHAHHFMNTENYEQVEISDDDLGDSAYWLAAGLKLQVQFYEGKPLGIELPKTVRAKIAETQPMVKSATASASYKPAKLENGVTVLVPPFVSEGEEIIVDPSENRYIERAK
jgi:elongation factor P